MEDKENENDFYIDDRYNPDITNDNKTLVNNLKAYSELNPQLSTIKKDTTLTMTSAKTLKEMLNDIKIPYPNKNEIPLIKIKDENYFENNESIENYIKSLVSSFGNSNERNDNKFNICKQCEKEKNKSFCKNCNKNICDICSENCKIKNHILIDLEKCLEEVNKSKKNIELFIPKNYIFAKKKQDSDGIEKKNKYYDIMDGFEFEANNDIEEKPMEYTNDIILIEVIIEKNYIISL